MTTGLLPGRGAFVPAAIVLCGFLWEGISLQAHGPLDIQDRRELFVDSYLIDTLENLSLKLHEPQLATPDSSQPKGDYMTILRDGGLYRLYYRTIVPGYTGEQYDGHPAELTCYAESTDGIHWTLPNLGLFEINGSRDNNAILAYQSPFSHNFSPFIDENPAVESVCRYKALAGLHGKALSKIKTDVPRGGLYAFVSSDGIRWKTLSEQPVITSEDFAFDSQNVAFWSRSEQCYVCYYRSWKTSHGKLRTISRTTSPDFLHWSVPVAMNPNEPGEHLYTSGTHPYFRAPHIYIALPTRFLPKRGSSTDILFMSSRGGNSFDRSFKEAFIRPGLDPARWGNRSNYAAWHVVPTGPAEISIYMKHLRYTLRTDGFVSVHAGYDPGTMVTKPFRFCGDKLSLNYSTSAAGSIQVEIQDEHGNPISGYALPDAGELAGDSIDRMVTWKNGESLQSMQNQTIRLRFVMKEADLYSMQFVP